MWYVCLSRPFLVKVNALLVFMLVTVLLHFLWYCKSVVYKNIICQQVVLKVWLRHGICRLIYLNSARKLLKLRKNTCAHCTHARTHSHTHAHTLSNCLSCFMLSRQFHVDTSRAAGLTESRLWRGQGSNLRPHPSHKSLVWNCSGRPFFFSMDIILRGIILANASLAHCFIVVFKIYICQEMPRLVEFKLGVSLALDYAGLPWFRIISCVFSCVFLERSAFLLFASVVCGVCSERFVQKKASGTW